MDRLGVEWKVPGSTTFVELTFLVMRGACPTWPYSNPGHTLVPDRRSSAGSYLHNRHITAFDSQFPNRHVRERKNVPSIAKVPQLQQELVVDCAAGRGTIIAYPEEDDSGFLITRKIIREGADSLTDPVGAEVSAFVQVFAFDTIAIRILEQPFELSIG